MGKDDMRIRILDAAAGLFDSRGMKFTMDELARDLGMSKKTIYTVFRDKMSLCDATVDYYFDSVREIAGYCGISESNAKTLLFRLRKQLREYLIKEGYEL